MALRSLQSLPVQDAPRGAAVSSGIDVGTIAGKPADPQAQRRLFPDRWGAFLRVNFHNHLHVAVFFSVDEKTARLWWNHVNQPQGWAVAYAVASIPNAAQQLLEAA